MVMLLLLLLLVLAAWILQMGGKNSVSLRNIMAMVSSNFVQICKNNIQQLREIF